MFRVFCLFWLVWALTEQAMFAADLAELPLTKQTSLRFATPEEGREAITRRDTFTEHLSKFDLQCRLKTGDAVRVEDLLKLYADNVTAWPAEEVAAVTKAAEFVREQLQPFTIAQPKTILLVRTTGREEAGAAYCRGPAIVLPANMIEQDGPALRRLLAHELFHVISTQNPELRRDLYAIIGFRICSPIELPAVLKDRALTNPDAPQIDAYIELKLADGEQLLAAPILLASADQYDAQSGKTLFHYLQFRLMQVEQHGDQWRAVVKDGQPRLIDPRGLASYSQQIGQNTGYIIHPDEILADNVAHLIMKTENLRSPEIIEKLRERLTKQP